MSGFARRAELQALPTEQINPGHGGIWTSVELLPGSEGGLYASYGSQKVLLAL